MSLSNEQIIYSLIAFYKAKGVNVTSMLGDPVFQKMPTEDKIKAIQKYAGEMHAASQGKDQVARADYISSGIIGGVTGALTGLGGRMTAMAMSAKVAPNAPSWVHFYNKPAAWKALGGTMAAMAVIGAGTGLLSAHLRSSAAKARQEDLVHQLGVTAKDPSLANAVGVLSTEGVSSYTHALRSRLTNAVASRLDSDVHAYMQGRAPEIFSKAYEINNRNKPMTLDEAAPPGWVQQNEEAMAQRKKDEAEARTRGAEAAESARQSAWAQREQDEYNLQLTREEAAQAWRAHNRGYSDSGQ